MPTLHTMAENVRQIWLGNPLPQRPTAHQLYGQLAAQTQRFYSRVARTGKPWAVGETTFQVLENVSDYGALSFPADMGKALLVYAEDTSTSYYPISWEMNTVDIQNVFSSGAEMSHWNWFGGNAGHIGLYRTPADGWAAKIFPVPRATRLLKVLYSVGNWAQSISAESSPILAEHHPAIEVATALPLLPDCAWGSDEAANMQQRAFRLESLRDERQRFESEFDAYISSLRQPRTIRASSGIGF